MPKKELKDIIKESSKRASRLQIGQKVTSDFHHSEKHVVRTITDIFKTPDCGSGYRISADDGGQCSCCSRPFGRTLSGIDGAYFYPAAKQVPESKKPTCKTCRHFNFKVSTDHAWGECLNPKVAKSLNIYCGLVHEIFECSEPLKLIKAIKKHARINYREDTFGCRFHEEEEDG